MSLLPLGPIRPDPRQAHDWLREELLRPEYRPGLLERVQDWFNDLLNNLSRTTGSGLGRLAVLVALLGLALLLAVVLSRLRRNEGGSGREPAEVFGAVRRTAQEHRRLALAAFAEQQWDDAVIEAMRALAADLVERRLVDDVPAATAHEVTTTAAPRFPAYQARLALAATVFDETRYGDHRATRERAGKMLDLERDLRQASAVSTRLGPVVAVPR